MTEGPPAADACYHNKIPAVEGGGGEGLAVPPLLVHPGVPSLSALTVVSSTLEQVFPLVTFKSFLGSGVFVPVPLPVVDMAEVFLVGMAVLISKCCLWSPVCVNAVVC